MGLLAVENVNRLQRDFVPVTPAAARVPPIYLSRQGLPAICLVIGTLVDGLGIFLTSDNSARIPFFANALIWFGLLHAASSLAIAVSLVLSRWTWRAEQQGALGFVMVGFAYFMLSSYLSIALFSPAHPAVKTIMLIALLAYHGWWGSRIVRWYGKAWRDQVLRKQMYSEEGDQILYNREGEKRVRERLGVKFFPSNLTMIGSVLLGLGSYFIRDKLTSYFGANWVPIAFAIWGFAISVFVTTMVTSSVLMCFVYPRRLRHQTGKPVYIDLLSPAPSISGR